MAKSKPASEKPRLLSHLKDPNLREVISVEKLSRSWQLIACLRAATMGAMLHGDTTDLRYLVLTFEGTAYQARLVRWFEDRCGLTITFTRNELQIKRRPNAVPRELSEVEYFPEAVRALAAKERLDKVTALEKKGIVANSDSTCLMDRGRRQSGSFEGGKRRS